MSSDADTAPSTIAAVQERILVAWREGTRTRAAELAALNAWIRRTYDPASRAATIPPITSEDPAITTDVPADLQSTEDLHIAIDRHLDAAREATRQRREWRERSHTGARLERAISNLDAAEADLLRVAPATYVLGQMPSVVNHVQRHLKPGDPRRSEIERIFKRLGVGESGQQQPNPGTSTPADHLAIVDQERGRIVSAVRGASSAALREQTRLRSFRNVVGVTTCAMFIVAIGLGLIGWLSPDTIPLCFTPEEAGRTTVVCPTEQSASETTPGAIPPPQDTSSAGTTSEDIDDLVRKTNRRENIAVVEIIGLTAAAIAAAGAIRGVRGSSEPYGIPIALALLKLPTGAVTAFLGLLLMRGEFVPGLSALDSSAQILAWAIVFGYAQQLFTRLVDQQAHSVLNDVRSGQKGSE